MNWKNGWPVGTSLKEAENGGLLTVRFHHTSTQPKNCRFGLEAIPTSRIRTHQLPFT